MQAVLTNSKRAVNMGGKGGKGGKGGTGKVEPKKRKKALPRKGTVEWIMYVRENGGVEPEMDMAEFRQYTDPYTDPYLTPVSLASVGNMRPPSSENRMRRGG